MPVTVPQTEANLLSYFQTGDKPTQDQFEELIRTMFYLYNVVVTSAAAAEVSAAAAQAKVAALPNCFFFVLITVNADNTYTIRDSSNVASVAVGTAGKLVQINFTAAAASTNYAVTGSLVLDTDTAANDLDALHYLDKQTTHVQIKLQTSGRTICALGFIAP
jgi:hypothetical protein